jgi:hypothetical protein
VIAKGGNFSASGRSLAYSSFSAHNSKQSPDIVGVRKIKVDPLTYPKPVLAKAGIWGILRILAFIEDQEVIKAILKHLGLWLVKSKPAPKAHAPLP